MAKATDFDWITIVNEAHLNRVNLSEHAHYATPGLSFDWSVAKGHPFAYHVYGTAIVGVTVDCLRGIYEIDFVKCVSRFRQFDEHYRLISGRSKAALCKASVG